MFNFDETSGLVITEGGAAYNNGGTLLTGASLTLNGTVTGLWDNAGFITPFGDNWFRPTTAARRTAMKNFMDASTLVAGEECIIVLADGFNTVDPSSTERWFDNCSALSGTGGWGLQMNTNGRLGISHRPVGAGSSETFSLTNDLSTTENTFAGFVIDGQNPFGGLPVVHVFNRGVRESSGVMTAPIGTGDDGASNCFTLFGQSGGATPNNKVNQAGSGTKIGRIFIQRTSQPMTLSIYRIMRDVFLGGQTSLSDEQASA